MSKTTSLLIFLIVLLHLFYAATLFLTGGLVYLQMFVAPNWKIYHKKYAEDHVVTCYPSTNELEDLVIPSTISPEDALRQVERHGSGLFRNAITNTTLEGLRDLVLQTQRDIIGKDEYTIETENRAKLILSHRQAKPLLKELESHPVFRPLLEGLLGPAASLIAVDTITNYPGAIAQHWHQDTSSDFNLNPSKFVKLITVVVPLQDTTSDMGATRICPGTHRCTNPSVSDTSFFETTWDASPELHDEYDSFEDWMDDEYPFCQMRVESKKGDFFLFNSDMFHKGEAHVNPNAMDRALIFITFAESRTGPTDPRVYPTGYLYNMHWDSWGHTIDDIATLDSWWPWQSFGFFNSQREGRIPWNIIDFMALIWMDEDVPAMVYYEALGVEYTAAKLEKLTWHAVKVAKNSLRMYAYGAMALLAVYAIRSMMMKVFGKINSPVKKKLN